MKVFGFCVLLWLFGVVFMPFNSPVCGGVDQYIRVSGRMTVDGNTMTTTATSRNMKSFNVDQGSRKGEVSLEDYRPIEPNPSSQASINRGPIEHDTPFHPYIPNLQPSPSPPSPSISDKSP